MPDQPLTLNPDRLFPADPTVRGIARDLYQEVKDLPIISPHGHVPVQWLADNEPFSDPTTLLLTPDHYTNRLLHSVAGVELEQLGVPVGTVKSRLSRARAELADDPDLNTLVQGESG